MGDTKNIIHIRIRDLRRERSLTQEELAAALGVSRQSVNAMEAGRCLPSLPVALELASFFAVPIHQLLADAQAEAEAVAALQEASTQITQWTPLREVREMLDGMMDESASWSPAPTSMPAVNVYQNQYEVRVDLRLPGFTKDEISLEVGADFLTVAGESAREIDVTHYFRREFILQSFSRTVALPAIVETDAAEAEMKNGILSVRLKKKVEEKPKTSRIQIKGE